MSDFFNAVYGFVKSVPKGKVVTYGDVARAIGAPRCARQVGWALHCNPQQGVIPCHRVVFADGSLTSGFAFGGIDIQKAMLVSEGVEVSEDYKVDLKNYRFLSF
ncbi:MAG: MGMT family protein [Clostridia bacterium]|nr:MGMT family protein [Clostridia bacterium]